LAELERGGNNRPNIEAIDAKSGIYGIKFNKAISVLQFHFLAGFVGFKGVGRLG
jgi:hypothetical protein